MTLQAPPRVTYGATVAVSGSAPPGEVVRLLFRRRGEASFTGRRILTAPAGVFSTTYDASDDYRLLAAIPRCDSPPVLVQVVPAISAPTRARRNQVVRIVVRAPAAVGVSMSFHRAGSSGYTVRRRGTTDAAGEYVTTYVADADYRYFASISIVGARRDSRVALTQVS
ncbi:MAG: hypothetical protein ABR520_03450 [Mycobacteriales bacterium]